MPTINNKVAIVNGQPIDKVYTDEKLVYSRNYFVSKTLTPGELIGTFINESNVNGVISDYIKISSGETWSYTSWLDKPWVDEDGKYRVFGYTLYDKEKNFVTSNSDLLYPYNQEKVTGTLSFNDDNVAYIRLTVAWIADDCGHFKFEKGSTPTPMSPAVEDII